MPGPVADGALSEQCAVGEGEWQANIDDGYMTEISGLAYSRAQPDTLWVHNDSGGSTWINAISEHGKSCQRYIVQFHINLRRPLRAWNNGKEAHRWGVAAESKTYYLF